MNLLARASGPLATALLLGMTGCMMNETNAKKPPSRAPAAPVPLSAGSYAGPVAQAGQIETEGVGPSQEPSRVAASAGWVGHLGPGDLTIWDLAKGTRAESVPLRTPRGVAALANGALLALHEPETGRYEVVLVRSGKPREVFPVVLTLVPSGNRLVRMFPDPTAADEFLVVGEQGAAGYQLALLGSSLRRRYSHKLSPKEAATATLSADGVLWFFRSPGLGQLGRGADTPLTVAFPELKESIWHLVPGPSATELYATVGLHRIARLQVAGRSARVIRTIDQGTGIVHALASSPQHLAVLVGEEAAGQAPRFTAIVYAQDGTQIMRAGVPLSATDAHAALSVYVAPSGYLAIASATQLRVFEIATGKLTISHGEATLPAD